MSAEGQAFQGRAATWILMAAAAAVLLVGLATAAHVLLLLFGAVLFAILLRAAAEGLSRLAGLPILGSLALVVLALLALIGSAAWFVAPDVASQFDQFVRQLPDAAARIEGVLRRYGWEQQILTGPDGVVGALEDPEEAGEWAARLLAGLVTAIGWALIIFFVAVYLAISPGLYFDAIVRLFPPARRPRAAAVLDQIGHTLRWWLITRVVSMAAVGLLTTLLLWAIGVPLALLLGLQAFALTFVPYIGPIAATVPIAIVAMTEGTATLGYAVALYTIIQSVEGFVIMPLAQDRLVHLPPAATLISEVLMGAWFGLVGVVFATPLAALPLVRRVYLEDVLGEGKKRRTAA